ncbi:MAG: hypothetical protein H5T62_15900 [Anaerolineae bacterium]|nr:hypothetical protein [Anaerolineae bacterium]
MLSLDAGGIIADVVSLGTVGRLTNTAKIARKTGDVLDVLSVARSWSSFSIAAVRGDFSVAEGADFGLDIAGLFVPVVPDVLSLGVNLSQGLYYVP